MKLQFFRLTASLSVACTLAQAATYYSDRPHVPYSPVEQKQAAKVFDGPASRQLLDSMLAFVIELRLLYPGRRRVYLARDAEAMYEMDWLLWQSHPGEDPRLEPVLINVSRATAKSPRLLDYLRQYGTVGTNAPPSVFVDTGYEGSVIDAINVALKGAGHAEQPAHLVSSVHPASPSSRVSTQAYLPPRLASSYQDADRETYLDSVDQHVEEIEHLPHFNASSKGYETNPRTGRVDAYTPEDVSEAEQARSAELQRQVQSFILGSHHWNGQEAWAEQKLERLLPLQELVHWLKNGGEQPAMEKMLALTAQNEFDFFWWDLREAFAKGTFLASRQRMALFWSQFPGGAPNLFDFDAIEKRAFLDQEKARLPENERPAESEAPKGAPTSTLTLIDAILDYHASQLKPEVQRERQAKLAHFRASLELRTFEPDGRPLRVNQLLGRGVRAQVYALGSDFAIKVPLSADDMRYIAVEAAVADFLEQHFDRFRIRTLPIVMRGTNGKYLIRRRLPPEALGENVRRKGLSDFQRDKLERLYERSRRLARETGVGLDIKYDNLAWLDGDWVVFDVGPRTSYGPYAFTLDVPNFEMFYRLWADDRPRKNGMTIEEVSRAAAQSEDCPQVLLKFGAKGEGDE